MSSSTRNSVGRSLQPYLAALVLAGGLALATSSAQAATWGHLRGPFSVESEFRERANFAAEEREELRFRTPVCLRTICARRRFQEEIVCEATAFAR
jgi:hypothetical protein